MKVDVLVVGAGPAGSMAARSASKNCDVLMIDKKTEIGVPKQCGEGVSRETFDRLGIKIDRKWAIREIGFSRLISPKGTVIDLKGEKMKKVKYGFVLDRERMDKYLAHLALNAGADLMLKTNFLRAERRENSVRVYARRMGKKLVIDADLVIAADGVISRVARFFGINTQLPIKYLESCAQYEVVGIDIDDCVELYFGSQYAPGGYTWIFPKGDNWANVGLGICPTMTKKDAFWYLDRFMKNDRVKGGKIIEINAGAVPVSGPIKKTYTDNLLIVGDAARLTNPITGGGIHTAMLSGNYAGQVACQATDEGDFSEKFLKRYQKLWHEDFGNELEWARKGQRIFTKLTDDDLEQIAQSIKDMEFEEVSTVTLIKTILKKNPKMMLKFKELL